MTNETPANATPCDRFEREGLLRLEQGLPLDPHFDECLACRQARAGYERLYTAIAAAGAEREPPPQWRARVWARIERRRAAARSRRRWFLWLVPVAATAAAMALVVFRVGPPTPGVALQVTLESGEGVRRGVEAQPGDRLLLRATTGDAPHTELRVYRDDIELVLRCSTEAPCVRRGDILRATLVLPAIGAYQPLLLVSDQPLPAPAESGLDTDADAALDAGARVELGDELRVQ